MKQNNADEFQGTWKRGGNARRNHLSPPNHLIIINHHLLLHHQAHLNLLDPDPQALKGQIFHHHHRHHRPRNHPQLLSHLHPSKQNMLIMLLGPPLILLRAYLCLLLWMSKSLMKNRRLLTWNYPHRTIKMMHQPPTFHAQVTGGKPSSVSIPRKDPQCMYREKIGKFGGLLMLIVPLHLNLPG